MNQETSLGESAILFFAVVAETNGFNLVGFIRDILAEQEFQIWDLCGYGWYGYYEEKALNYSQIK